MSINRTSLLTLVMRSRKSRLALVLLLCLLICFIVFLRVIGDIEAAPGQSIEGQLNLLVNESKENKININAPSISDFQLMPDEIYSQTGILRIKAKDGNWQIMVQGNPSGYMTDWTKKSGYGLLQLTNPMEVAAKYKVPLSEGGVIQDGTPTIGYEDIPVTFSQECTFIDAPLPVDHEYRIEVTFTASYI